MSGIIGGAGSKSGVIGETELDYEEGDWTVTSVSGGNVTSNSAKYIKIGKMVMINAYIDITSASGSSQQLGGLPYTPTSGIYSMITAYARNDQGLVCRISPSSTTMYVFNDDTSAITYILGDDLNGSYFMLSGTYQAA